MGPNIYEVAQQLRQVTTSQLSQENRLDNLTVFALLFGTGRTIFLSQLVHT